MKNEMDLMRMDEYQRYAWLCANRLTLMIVGAVWIGMIVSRVSSGQNPWFLIAMVPVFALIRFAAYHCAKRGQRKTPPGPTRRAQSSPRAQSGPGDHGTGGSFTLLLP